MIKMDKKVFEIFYDEKLGTTITQTEDFKKLSHSHKIELLGDIFSLMDDICDECKEDMTNKKKSSKIPTLEEQDEGITFEDCEE